MFKLARRALAGALLTAACGRDAPPVPAPPPATRADGQWVWTSADQALWTAARMRRPGLRPGVWVSTLTWERGAVVQRLARSPRLVRAGGAAPDSVAVVVRIEDAMHQVWADAPDSVLAARVDARLAALLARVAAAGAPVAEVQLDYDCPVRRLARWAGVVARLRSGALRGREVWVTSVPAHLAQPAYGDLFRPVVSGHIVQLFDTGDQPDSAALPRLQRALARAALPYRVGLGAFERVRGGPGGGRTRHRQWFRALPAFAASPWYRGVWVFPGGQPWEELVAP